MPAGMKKLRTERGRLSLLVDENHLYKSELNLGAKLYVVFTKVMQEALHPTWLRSWYPDSFYTPHLPGLNPLSQGWDPAD